MSETAGNKTPVYCGAGDFFADLDEAVSSSSTTKVPGGTINGRADAVKDTGDQGNSDQSHLDSLFEVILQTPSTITSCAKRAAELIGKYECGRDALAEKNPVLRIFVDRVIFALVENIPPSVSDVIIRFCSLIDVFETSTGLGHHAPLKIISEVVMLACRDERAYIRARCCRLMREVLSLENETFPEEEVQEEQDSFFGSQESNKIPKSNDSTDDEELSLSPKSREADERTFRNIGWAHLLDDLRADQSAEVRMEAVRALSRLPDVKLPTATSAYPDQLVLRSLHDVSEEVRMVAAECFSISSPAVVNEAIRVIGWETSSPVRLRVLSRLIKDVNIRSFTKEQQNKLLEVCFSCPNDAVHRLAVSTLVPSWLRALSAEGKKATVNSALLLVDPLVNMELAEKIVMCAANACRRCEIDDGASIIAWVRLIRSDENYGSGPDQPPLLSKETTVELLNRTTVSELPDVCRSLFLYRCFVQYCMEEAASAQERDEVADRMLPTMAELATVATRMCENLSLSPSQLSFDEEMKEQQELAATQLCALLRMQERSDVVGRRMWREFLFFLIRDRFVVRDRKLLDSIMTDAVDHTTLDKQEAMHVVEEVAYIVHALLTGDPETETIPDCNEKNAPIKEENIPRCTILLESMLKNSSVDNYSVVVKNLVFQLAEVASVTPSVRPEACRVIGLAAMMDDDVFKMYAAVLAVVPATCFDEQQTKIACAEALGDLICARGLTIVSETLYLEDEPTQTDSQGSSLSVEKVKPAECKEEWLLNVIEVMILDTDAEVSVSAAISCLRVMLHEDSRWARILSRCVLAAHFPKASSKLKSALDTFCDHIITNVLEERLFIVSCIWEAICWYETQQDSINVNLSAVLHYFYDMIKEENTLHVKPEPDVESVVVEDWLVEYSLLTVILAHMRSYPDSDLCSPLANFICVIPLFRARDFPQRLNTLVAKCRNVHQKLSINDQVSAACALSKMKKKLERIQESLAKPRKAIKRELLQHSGTTPDISIKRELHSVHSDSTPADDVPMIKGNVLRRVKLENPTQKRTQQNNNNRLKMSPSQMDVPLPLKKIKIEEPSQIQPPSQRPVVVRACKSRSNVRVDVKQELVDESYCDTTIDDSFNETITMASDVDVFDGE